jgi:translation initiation factor 2 subunit 2
MGIYYYGIMEYTELLKRGRSQLPASVFEKQRFEIPKVLGHLQGNRTVISNFRQIANTLRRPVDHLLKYILKELATPGELTQSELIMGTKIAASRINEKIRSYAEEFVLCAECGKPDTQIVTEEEVSYLKCQACGAKRLVKSKI